MSESIQEYVAGVTRKTSEDLIKIVLELPEEKRGWSPLDKGRSALDQIAECALLNRYTATVVESASWPESNFAEFLQKKAALAQDWEAAQKTFQENTEFLISVEKAVPTEKLSETISTPFGPMTIQQLITYPVWNMSYHEGQINYILSLLAE